MKTVSHTCTPKTTDLPTDESIEDFAESVDELREKLANMKKLMEERKGTTLEIPISPYGTIKKENIVRRFGFLKICTKGVDATYEDVSKELSVAAFKIKSKQKRQGVKENVSS
ncbi:hypothetical protein KM043_011371 [Ampulex compressa]|nr:hypothetical protein KM043_011371 [Ampulex compressa]